MLLLYDPFLNVDVLQTGTSLVLINGIYFKGFWEYKFDPEKTSKQPFLVAGKKKIKLDMMHIQTWLKYGKLKELKAKAVALPYKGDRLSMVIILPKNADGLAKIKSKIGSVLRNGKSVVMEYLSTETVELSLPKFKIETTLASLTDVLKNVKNLFLSFF